MLNHSCKSTWEEELSWYSQFVSENQISWESELIFQTKVSVASQTTIGSLVTSNYKTLWTQGELLASDLLISKIIETPLNPQCNGQQSVNIEWNTYNLRSRDNTPAPLLNMDREHEEQMINNFRSEMESKIREKEREQQEEKNERTK